MASPLFFSFSSCSSIDPQNPLEPYKIFSSRQLFDSKKAFGCKNMLDVYCDYLYSPEASGNLQVGRAKLPIHILQGETENHFSQVFYQYSKAKILNQEYFPKDFWKTLLKYRYFEKLEELLHRHPITSMSLAQRVLSEHLRFEVESIWSTSINETIIKRMSQKYRGYHSIPEKLMPVELDLERGRIRRTLISELSKAIWRDDKNWEKVENSFTKLKEAFLRLFNKLDIPKKVREEWTKRITEVELVLPGSTPAISDEECSTTTINAYYYKHLNLLTVCAGDFNSEDINQTLAHEMAHSLGMDRSIYLFQRQSEFGIKLSELRAKVCSPEEFSCDSWMGFRSKFDSYLRSIAKFQPNLPDFQRCLKRGPTDKLFSEEESERIAQTITKERIAEFASNNLFLRITKPQLPMRDGQLQNNPNYFNPCNYYLWSQGEEPVDDELTTLMFFTAQYRCSAKEGLEKFKEAIDMAKDMTSDILENTLMNEGEFSDRNEMVSEGFASPSAERFADVLGSYAMAEYLSQLENLPDRQNTFLAANSWLCKEPSLASHFPEENAIEDQYTLDSHTEGSERQKELFSEPIRKVLGCKKDFVFNECKLPFKR